MLEAIVGIPDVVSRFPAAVPQPERPNRATVAALCTRNPLVADEKRGTHAVALYSVCLCVCVCVY